MSDRAYYDTSQEDYYPEYIYSDELTESYHGGPYFEPNSSLQPAYGQRTAAAAYIDYWVYDLGLTGEAKWPIVKHFEIALQYNTEILYYQTRLQYEIFEFDSHISSDYEDILDFNHFANLLLRFKF